MGVIPRLDITKAIEEHRAASLNVKLAPISKDCDDLKAAAIDKEERCWRAVLDATPNGHWQLAQYAEYLACAAIDGPDPETRTGPALDCLRHAVLKIAGVWLADGEREEAAAAA